MFVYFIDKGNSCPYKHDPDKVAVCRLFLKGECYSDLNTNENDGEENGKKSNTSLAYNQTFLQCVRVVARSVYDSSWSWPGAFFNRVSRRLQLVTR